MGLYLESPNPPALRVAAVGCLGNTKIPGPPAGAMLFGSGFMQQRTFIKPTYLWGLT